MRTAFPLRQRYLFPAALMVLALFLLGLLLGALAAPVSALAALYQQGGQAVAVLSPATGRDAASGYPAALLLQTAGLPLALETAELRNQLTVEEAAEAEAAAESMQEESILVIAKPPQ